MTKEKIKEITLYKYMSTKHLEDILENEHLYCSDTDDLNDPFELKVFDKVIGTFRVLKDLRVLCLTNSHLKKLMWSHYADSHKGVCLKVKVPVAYVRPVCYSSKRLFEDSDIDLIFKSNKNRKIKKNCTIDYSMNSDLKMGYIKDAKWIDEKEYRIVTSFSMWHQCEASHYYEIIKKENDKERLFFKVKIKEIIFGLNYDFKDGANCIEICKEKGIKMSKIKYHLNRYELLKCEYLE